MVKEELPHQDVPPEFLVEGNKMPRVADPSSEIDDPLHEGTAWGDNPTSELESPNQGLKVAQTTGLFRGP